MDIVNLKELEEIVASHTNTAYMITSGAIHEGHKTLCKNARAKLGFDILIIVFPQYLLNYTKLFPNYTSYFNEDCEKLKGIADYAIKIPYDDEIGKLYEEHDNRCRKLIDWNEWKHPKISLENVSMHYIAGSLLLPYEELLFKTKFRLNGEKSLLPMRFMTMLQQRSYPDVIQNSKDVFFPCWTYKGTKCIIDSTDINCKDLQEKIKFTETLSKIKYLVSKDKNPDEIFAEIGWENPQNIYPPLVLYWSGKDLTLKNRPSECEPFRFTTSKGDIDGSIMTVNYFAGFGYVHCFLFDTQGRFPLDED
jgi:hypothetical protein